MAGLSERLYIGVPIKETGPSKTLPAQFRGSLIIGTSMLIDLQLTTGRLKTCKIRDNIKSEVFIIKECDWSTGNLFDNV